MTMITEQEPFSENPVMIGYDNRIFEGDETLGFKFPDGRLITSKGFVSLDELISKTIKCYPVFLNIGDSSTSGWDSNRIFKGSEDLNAAFFSYKTYSDLLQEQLGSNVINAGVPGYTSYQGRRYLEILLKKLFKSRVRVDYVTIYFGNNDCTYNQYEDKVKLDAKMPSASSRGERVNVEDFRQNLRYMIELCREYGARPILIIPPAHYDWEPGIRADKYREESLKILQNLGNGQLAQELEKARSLYEQCKFKQSCDTDRVLPRLKSAYRKALLQVARTTKTDMINVQSQIPLTDNAEYFADYCHPLERTNQMIVDRIKEIRHRDLFHKPLLRRIKDAFKSDKGVKPRDGPPPNIYAGIW